ncbi:MAG: Tyrosine recombinase XerD [bacterium ADurb.Bin429]|nr:MAG: Tyrosine recombinase XerD [bacterium ADurb.Bin429]
MRKTTLSPQSAPVTFADAVDRFQRRCAAKNLSDSTRAYYGFHLTALMRYLDTHAPTVAPAEVTPDVLRGFITHRLQVSAVTAYHSLLTLRVFFGFLVKDGTLAENPATDLDPVRRKRPLIPTFSPDQITALLAACQGKAFHDVRDRALLMLLLDTGLRASELCTLRLENIDWTECTVTVWGKGGKQRAVPFGEATRQTLLPYLDRRGELGTPMVFVTCYGDPLTRRRLQTIIHNRGTQAKIARVRCSPHTFRHTFAVMYLRNGGDVFSLQKLLGHSDLTMTRRYAELSDTDVREKHRTYSPGDRFLDAVKPVTKRQRLR